MLVDIIGYPDNVIHDRVISTEILFYGFLMEWSVKKKNIHVDLIEGAGIMAAILQSLTTATRKRTKKSSLHASAS